MDIEKGVKEYLVKVGSVHYKDIIEHDFRAGIQWAVDQQKATNDSKSNFDKLIKKLPKHKITVRITEDDPIGHGFSSHEEIRKVILLEDIKKGLRDL